MGLLNYLALALTVFEVVTDFNAERGNPENGKV